MTDSMRFWNGIARKYAAQPVRNMSSYRQTMERTRAHLSSGDHLLEVGCGSGATALLLAPDVARITGSDISSEMIAIACEKAAENGAANADFIRATPHDDAFPDAPYDAVLAFNVIHLLGDVPAALARLRALLKPGGLLISKTACIGGWRGLLFRPVIAAMRIAGEAPPVTFLTPTQPEAMVAGAGFEIVESGFHGDSRPFIVARRS